jgi:hypothetical protein
MSANPDNPPFLALADAPHDGSPIEVRHGPDQEIVLARWFAQTQAWIRDGDPYRRTLHRVTGWRATEEQIAETNERQRSVAAVANPVPATPESRPAKTAIVKARKPRQR